MIGCKILLTTLVLSSVIGWMIPEEHVEYVDQDDLDVYVANHPIVLVHWYESWCSFCREFAPTWSAMADIVAEAGNDIKLIKVEVNDDKDLKAAYSVEIVPDFGVFVNNAYYHFNGRKEPGDLFQFVANRTQDGILKVNNVDQVSFLKKNGNVMMVGIFDQDSEAESLFKQNVLRDRNCLFVIPTSDVRDELQEMYHIQSPSILALKSFDEFSVVMTEEFTNENIKIFIDLNSHPVVYPTRNPRYNDYLYSHGSEWMTLLIDEESATFPSSLSQRFMQMCQQSRDAVCFYIGKDEKNRYDYYTEGKNLQFPAMITVRHVRGYHFKYYFPPIKNESLESLLQYQKGILSGVIPPEMNSDPLPKNDLPYLQTVVSSNFKKEVMESNEDIVIQFYSDSCDHCSKMMKRFEKAASLFAEDKDIRFMRFSSNTNDIDIEAIHAYHYHSVLFIHKGNAVTVTEYPRSRKVWRTKSLVKWIISQRENVRVKVDSMEEEL